ncbi:MAG: hypothetical protein KIT18_05750 [Burkholderiales bacterium]|nr:hypothetical protein [Burkholderiales bacterium]
MCAIISLMLALNASAIAADSSADQFAKTYFLSMKSFDPSKLASGMHPQALEQFRQVILGAVTGASPAKVAQEVLPVFGVKSVAELEKLSAQDFYAAFFAGLGNARPSFKSMMGQSNYDVLGSVVEQDLAHVVYRIRVNVQGQNATRIGVLSLKRNGNTWGALLTTEVEGMANSLRTQLQ